MTSWGSSETASENSETVRSEDDGVFSVNLSANSPWWTRDQHENGRTVYESGLLSSMEREEVRRPSSVTPHRRHNTALVHPAPGSLSPRILGAGKAGLLSPDPKGDDSVGNPASFKGSNHVGSPSASSSGSRHRCSSADRGSNHVGSPSASSVSRGRCASAERGSNHVGSPSASSKGTCGSVRGTWLSSAERGSNHVESPSLSKGSNRSRSSSMTSENGRVRFVEAEEADGVRNGSGARGTRRAESFGARDQRADSVGLTETYDHEASPRLAHKHRHNAGEGLSRGSDSPGSSRLKGNNRAGLPKGDNRADSDGVGRGDAAGVGRDSIDVGRDSDSVGRDYAGVGRDSAGTGRNSAGMDRDSMRRDSATTGRDGAGVGRDSIDVGRDSDRVSRDFVRVSRESMGKDSASKGRDNAGVGRDSAGACRDSMGRDDAGMGRDGTDVGRDSSKDSVGMGRDCAGIGRDRSRDRGRSGRSADNPNASAGHEYCPLTDIAESGGSSYVIEPLDSVALSDREGFTCRSSLECASLSDRHLAPIKPSLRQCTVSEASASYRHGMSAAHALDSAAAVLRASPAARVSPASSCASPSLQLRNGQPRTQNAHLGLLSSHCVNGAAHHHGGLGAHYGLGSAAAAAHQSALSAHCGSGPTSPEDFTSSSSTSSVSSVRETLSDSASVGGGAGNVRRSGRDAYCDPAPGGGATSGRRSGREGSAHRVTFDMSTCSKDDGHRTCSRRPALPASLLRDGGGGVPEAGGRGSGRDGGRSRSSHTRSRTRYESLSPRARSESLPPRRNCDPDLDLDPSALDQIILELQRTAAGEESAVPTISVTGSASDSEFLRRGCAFPSPTASQALSSSPSGSHSFLSATATTTTTTAAFSSSPSSSTDSGTTPSPAPSPGIYRRKNGFSRSLGEISALLAKRSIVDSYDLEACWFCGRPMVGLPTGVTGGDGGGLSQTGALSPSVCTRGTRFSPGLSSGGR